MITKDMTIGEIVKNYPEKIEVLASAGMGCVSVFLFSYAPVTSYSSITSF